jgi:tetratricopeptide (TPR) repeat protein
MIPEKKRLCVLLILIGLAVGACGVDTPANELETSLQQAYATQTAQAAKSDALLEVVAELQATRSVQSQAVLDAQALATQAVEQSSSWQEQIAQLKAERDTQATQVAEAQLQATRMTNEIAKLQGIPTPTLDAAGNRRVEALFQKALTLYEQDRWDEAAAKLGEIQILDATYRPEQVTSRLFESYYRGGLGHLAEGQVDEAARRFARALELRADDQAAQEQQALAELYLAGQSAWNTADWSAAVEAFDALYELDPNYVDVNARLREAHVRYGDALAEEERWCAARDQYAAAQELEETTAVDIKRERARTRCGTSAERGTYVGRFVGYEDLTKITTNWAAIRGNVTTAQAKAVPGITVQIQAYDWSARATTDGNGRYAFDFLTNELTFTVSLIDLPSEPTKALTKFGHAAQVDFVEEK